MTNLVAPDGSPAPVPPPRYSVDQLKGKAALMLKIDSPHPGWTAVRNQARDVGMEPTPDDKLHLTVVFLGKDLSPKRADEARDATLAAMREVAARWEAGQRAEARSRGILELRPDELKAAFVPLRFPGQVGQFINKAATHVHAVAELNAALRIFRELVVKGYPGKVSSSYSPHATLAEGPKGTRLPREMEVPAGTTLCHTVVLKLGTVREVLHF